MHRARKKASNIHHHHRSTWLGRSRPPVMHVTSLLLLLSLPTTTFSASPTRPDQADSGSVPVTAPVNVKSTLLKLSPEQLVVASMPWEGMDQPEAQRKTIFPRQDPWDTPPDSTMHRPFGHYAAIPARPPPFIPGDVDTTNEEIGNDRSEQEWMRQSRVPSLPAVGPAFYGRDSKPDNYYLNPLVKHSATAAPIMSLLEILPEKVHPSQHSRLLRRHRSTPPTALLETLSKSTGNTYWLRQHPQRQQSPHLQLQRMEAVGVHLQSTGPPPIGDAKGPSPFIIPPVGTNNEATEGMAPPALAVLGDQSQDMTVAPRVQQFTGSMNWEKDLKDGKPLPGSQPYANDHPSGYQQQPLWPPAPPEPLFPLKGED